MNFEEFLMEGNKSGDSSLHDWFNKSKSSDGTKGWVQLGGKYAGKPCARQPGQTTKPKCGSSKMKRNLSKDEEQAAFRRKNNQDPDPNRSGKAKNVATEGITYEDFMSEQSVYGLGKAFAKRQIKNKAVDTKNAVAAQGRQGKVGKLANKASSVANDAQKVKDNVQTAKTAGHIAKRQLAKRAPKAAAKASKFLKPATKLATKAANVASKVTKPVSKVLGSKVLGPAAVGTGIADLTFNNPKVRKAYQNYSPKKTFGFGPEK